jgi:hypothetical protein
MIVSIRQWPMARFLPWATKKVTAKRPLESEGNARNVSIFDVWQRTLESQVNMVLHSKD